MPEATDSSHLSDVSTELMIEQYGGVVEVQFFKSSGLREMIDVIPVVGTDTITNNRVGRTVLQKLVPGVRPTANPTGFGKVSVTVDTVIIARDARSKLNDFQTHFSAREKLGQDHGKELAKDFDQSLIIQAIHGSHQAAPTGLNGSIGAGKSIGLLAANDEEDPDKVVDAIKDILVEMEDEEIPTEELVILVRPSTFKVLKENDKLMSRDFAAGNGDYAKGLIYEIDGARVIKTTRIPTAAITGHKLSNAANGSAYDLTAEDADAIAVIMHPKSLLVGETIPLTSDVHYDKIDLTWYIDSYMAYGVNVNRPDVCGTVNKYRA